MNNIPMVELSNGGMMPPMIMGTYKITDYKTLKKIIRKAVKHGFTGLDTAYAYENEAIIGNVVAECMRDFSMQRSDFYITDKIDIWQMQETQGKISENVEEALRKLNTDYLDLLLIHWPLPEYFVQTWESFVKVFEQGKVKAIGISNVKKRHLKQIITDTGFSPHVVQNERHPLHTDTKVLEFCKSNDIVYQAYSPVARMIEPLPGSMELNTIAEKYNKTVGQVIIRWQIQTGAVPVFMTQKTKRIEEYAGVFDFKLEEHEIHSISSLDINYKMTLESVICPGF
ncbi:aldo/keto reductase family protein [Maribellus maritimus]|uniref:aldo/keto reductase family protein n=1 Tax=Maribellus maritimus TaxID=2870838 RepID=UPI001EEC24EF|nr:aldo/keto reductase [Maribellus maritimus]MCG6191501.1 aldo/keto reductase [Maribellus maritimus]